LAAEAAWAALGESVADGDPTASTPGHPLSSDV
jgi:hypothetical protein